MQEPWDHIYSARVAAAHSFLNDHPELYNSVGHYVCYYDKLHNNGKLEFKDYFNMSIPYKIQFINKILKYDPNTDDVKNIDIMVFQRIERVITDYKKIRFAPY